LVLSASSLPFQNHNGRDCQRSGGSANSRRSSASSAEASDRDATSSSGECLLIIFDTAATRSAGVPLTSWTDSIAGLRLQAVIKQRSNNASAFISVVIRVYERYPTRGSDSILCNMEVCFLHLSSSLISAGAVTDRLGK